MSELEQWKLVAALYQHGMNTEALSKACPELGRDSLQHLLMTKKRAALRRQARKEQTEEAKFLSKWLPYADDMHLLQGTLEERHIKKGRVSVNLCPKDHGPLLSKVMLFASEKEEHPPASSQTDPDYREIYRYLSQLLAGEEPSQLSPGSATKVLEMFKKIETVTKSSKPEGHMNCYINMNIPHLKVSRVRVKKLHKLQDSSSEHTDASDTCALFHDETEGNEEEEELGAQKQRKKREAITTSLMDMPGLNPFCMTSTLLAKPQQVTQEAP